MKIKKENKKKGFVSIRTRLVLGTVLLIILSISGVKIYDFQNRIGEIEENVQEKQLNNASLTAVRLETEIAKTVAVLDL